MFRINRTHKGLAGVLLKPLWIHQISGKRSFVQLLKTVAIDWNVTARKPNLPEKTEKKEKA